MKVDEQLQARILTFVVREFLNNKRATPRRDVILAFETEEVSEALGNLTNRSLLRRKDNVCPEQYGTGPSELVKFVNADAESQWSAAAPVTL